MPRGYPKPKNLAHPANAEEWRDHFKKATIRVGFQVAVTRTMLECLCAVADGVGWDRHKFGGGAVPDNWIASERALVKRGLIQRADQDERVKRIEAAKGDDRFYEWNGYDLTPAGIHVVELVKMAGIFVEADAAIKKKARRA